MDTSAIRRPYVRFSVKGFTLIELMMVSAIIGLLAAIALPKFGGLIERAHDANNLAKLGSIRSAISIYYADNEGLFPNTLTLLPLLWGKYLDTNFNQFSLIKSRHTADTGSFTFTDYGNGTYEYVLSPDFDKTFSFYLPYGPSSIPNRSVGSIWVNCTHTNSRGRVWSNE